MTSIVEYWALGTIGLAEVLLVDNLSTGSYLTALKPQPATLT